MLTTETIRKKDIVITITSNHALPEKLVERVNALLEEGDDEYVSFEDFEKTYKASLKAGDAIGHKIKMMRIAKKMKQTDMAKAIGMMQPQLSAIESGEHTPSMKTLKKIAAVLKVDIEDLV